MQPTFDDLKALAAQLRVDSIRSTTTAGSGHPTSSISAADLMAVLHAKYLRFDWNNPKRLNNDRLIFSKGHACPLLYSMFKAAGAIDEHELLLLRKNRSRMQGHPNPRVLPLVDVATGSLGMGLAIGVGMALSGKYLDRVDNRVWVLLGDSEMAEGSVWEAFDKGWTYKLNNLIAIIDMNRLGQRGPTNLQWDSATYANRARAFGWHALEIDGHDLGAIDRAYEYACKQTDRPTCIIAKTKKGAGVDEVADKDNWHGKALPPEMAERAIAALGGVKNRIFPTASPTAVLPPKTMPLSPPKLPTYAVGTKEATRKAYGDALAALGTSHYNLVAVDGEVSNSTYADIFAKAHPERFFEMFIAEQCMVSVANGLAVLDKRVFASSFAAFLTRAYDQIRMAAIAGANLSLSGSHAGVSIGEDGPSQMALEDLAMMRAIFGSTVLYPSDPNQAAQLIQQMCDLEGISYIRTTREKLPVIYQPTETFTVGGSKTLKSSAADKLAIVAAGITVHEALAAAELLAKEGIAVRVIDAYSIKPIDKMTMRQAAKDCGKIITVEDHWPQGGLGDAVLEALSGKNAISVTLLKMAPKSMPGSASPAEMLDAAGINASAIVKAVKGLV
ncbi:MAG TPA: transketolase [Gemmatales bacterium]|nr:transketolase [Gemmatales bacterium]